MILCGTSVHPVDPKGRVSVPRRIQEGLTRTPTGSVTGYVAPGEDGCLLLFPVEGFQEAAGELSQRVFSTSDVRSAKRAFFGSSYPFELDTSGRLLLPEELRTRAGIAREVTIVGVEDRAEIWDPRQYAAQRDRDRDVLARLDRLPVDAREEFEDG